MADLSAYFFDTSVILAGIIELDPERTAPARIMDAIAQGHVQEPMTAWHCCLEFFSVATRLPREFRLGPVDAAMLVRKEILARFRIHGLPANRRETFIDAIAHEPVAGGRVYDAHIAEIARHAKATMIVTENRRHFTQVLRHGIRVLTSEELLEQL